MRAGLELNRRAAMDAEVGDGMLFTSRVQERIAPQKRVRGNGGNDRRNRASHGCNPDIDRTCRRDRFCTRYLSRLKLNGGFIEPVTESGQNRQGQKCFHVHVQNALVGALATVYGRIGASPT